MTRVKAPQTRADHCSQLGFPEWRFGGYTRIDGTVSFYQRIHALLGPEDVLADVGCGRGAFSQAPDTFHAALRTFRGKCRKVIGIDLDPIGETNPSLDEFRLIPSGDAPWPLEDGSINLCLSDQVLEHIAEPDRFFAEAHRILAPGGLLCLRTTNAHGYVALVSRLIPERFHAAVLRRAQPDRGGMDVFKTYFRCNTKSALEKQLRKHHFSGCVLHHEAEPSYLAFSGCMFKLGLLLRFFQPRYLSNSLFVYAEKV